MNETIVFSIIVPHYNMVPKLRRLLDSVPVRENIETIVVDDYSNDDAEFEKLKTEYENRNIIFFKNDGKKSAGTCRNIGLDKARGKWILFADADDYFLSDMYETISQYADSESDIVFFSPTSINEKTNEQATRHTAYARAISRYIACQNRENELWLRTKMDPPWSKLYRKELIDKNKIVFDEIIRDNDTMFSVTAGICAEKISVTDKTIYCCTRNEGSLTTNNTYNHLLIKAEVFVRKYSYVKENLSRDDFDKLDMNGRIIVTSSLFYQKPLRSFASVLFLFARNRIRIIPRKIFRIEFWKKYINSKQFIYDYKSKKEAKEFFMK